MRTRVLLIVFGIIVLLLTTNSVQVTASESYTFTKIAHTLDGFGEFGNDPSINNRGEVVFIAILDTAPTPVGTRGILIGDGGPLTLIVDNSGIFRTFADSPTINEAGTIVFEAELDGVDPFSTGGSGIFSNKGIITKTIVDTSGPFSSFGFATINNAATIAFVGVLDAGGSGIFTIDRTGATTTIVASSSAFPAPQSPSINDAGVIAFSGHSFLGPIGVSHRGAITSLIDRTGPFSVLLSPTINNQGTVAFRAAWDTGGSGIFIASRAEIITIADSNGSFDQFGAVAINNANEVAFLASLDEGGWGIFTGPDPVTDKVITTRDTLFGAQIIAVEVLRQWLNDRGQIAFKVFLDDGTQAIVRADPLGS